MNLIRNVFIIWFVFSQGVFAASYNKYNNTISFENWKKEFSTKAIQSGVSKQTLKTYLKPVKLHSKIIGFDRAQPEFMKTFGQYISGALSKTRINKARALYKKHYKILNQIYLKYGVEPHYIIAFWGLETNFGKNMGSFNVIRSLATLSYDLRRQAFFEKELILALKIVQQGHIKAKDFLGSWAGAFGQTQFMPSTFTAYAVDFDNDNRKNLWTSKKDIFASSSYFLKRVGWKKGENWGREVKIKAENIRWYLRNKDKNIPLVDWYNKGVRALDGTSLKNTKIKARLILPAGANGPAFLVYNNFKTILKWNNSNFYALSVGLLANEIIGKKPMQWQVPNNEKALDIEQVKYIQLVLLEKGYYSGDVDGIFGALSQKSLRLYQKDMGVLADGFLNEKAYNYVKGKMNEK